MSASNRGLPPSAVALVALFVTGLVTAQLTAAKLLGFSLPFSIPVAGATLALPGAALAYALTFFASDCYAELHGKRPAQVMVNVGFVMNFVMLALVYTTIEAPALPGQDVPPEQFERVLWSSANIVVGSLLAYIVSQNWDVIVFHRIREVTGREKLWLRNIASTGTSQAIDTIIFVGVTFYALPKVGINTQLGLPLTAAAGPSVAALVVGQYLLKLLIAIADTPFVYLVTGFVRARESGHEDVLFAESR